MNSNDKVCRNCIHCIKITEELFGLGTCKCKTKNRYLSTFELLQGWCQHWTKEVHK